MMLGLSKLKVNDLNEHVTCMICGGYIVDATTIIECLHSFCRSCIVSRMMIDRCCPKCEVPAHKTRPLLNIRSDKTLQDIVYKVVPNLLEKEKARKRQFHEETGIPIDAEVQRDDSVTLTPEKKDHCVSLSLEYDSRELNLSEDSQWTRENLRFPKRYLRCYDAVFVSTINKLVRRKLGREDLEVLCFCRGEVLPERYTLSDVASTFSWKSDRPLSLTYMTFSTKCQKRKISTAVENEEIAMAEVPAKKLAVTPSAICDTLKQAAAAAKVLAVAQPIPKLQSHEPTASNAAANVDSKRDTNIVNPLPKTKSSPWKTNSETQQAPKPTQQVMGVKIPPYTIRNSPFVNTSASRNNANMASCSITQSISSSTSSRPVSFTQSQTFSPFTPSQGKVKSINSIANRLQMEKVKLAPMKTEPHTPANVPDSVKVNSNSTNSSFMKQSANPLRSSWIPSDASANMKRNLMAQRFNASTFRSQGFKEEQMNALTRQDLRPGTSGSMRHSSRTPDRSPRLPSPNLANFVRYRLPVRSNPPNYNQATNQQSNSIRIAQQRQIAIRPKFNNMQRSVPVRNEQHQNVIQQQHMSRRKNVARTDDPQLLSTTLQLASLRQQQKLLNEIAAAVSARNSNSHSTDSIRAVMSGLSPKSSSTPRSGSHNAAAINALRKATPPSAMRSVARPVRQTRPAILKSPTVSDSSGRGTSTSPKGNGAKSFNEVSHMSNTMGYPSMNKRREGGIDIYQNTIARAKAQLREMNMKDRAVHQHRTQLRAAVSPYNVQSPTTARKQTAPYRPPAYQNYMHRSPSTSAAATSINHPRRSAPSTYKGVTTKPPPPPQTPHRYILPAVFQNSMPNRQHRPPPPTSHARIPPVVKQADTSIPEQDQPLCLVVKK